MGNSALLTFTPSFLQEPSHFSGQPLVKVGRVLPSWCVNTFTPKASELHKLRFPELISIFRGNFWNKSKHMIYILSGFLDCKKTMIHSKSIDLHFLCFSLLHWLTRDFKYETFQDQWIPLKSIWSFNERTRPKKITSQKRKSSTTGRGLTRSTLTASACERLYNISKLHAVPVF